MNLNLIEWFKKKFNIQEILLNSLIYLIIL